MDEKAKVGGATGAAVGLSGFSAFIGLCCLGPWAVSLFGVSTAVTMARFDFLRPWLVGVAAIALVWAFWRVYRPRPAHGDCEQMASPWLKGTLWLAAVLTLAVFFADQLQWWLIDFTPEALQ